MSTLEDFEDDDIQVPESLKNMVVAEVDTIRDVMSVVNMFLGEPAKAMVTLLNELEQKK
jgi:hypothetical protein